jgi:hypothetical protein
MPACARAEDENGLIGVEHRWFPLIPLLISEHLIRWTSPDPCKRLVISHEEHALDGLDILADTPAGDESARQGGHQRNKQQPQL